ncbi:putative serine/threonine-protein kinase PBL11 [Bidens hawaiensis]|uniref:putative serine/threonine-protein kinase PBL11 n=1 Tax=Bidens hawaiensis TaxID=980011 RepID=UPI00404A5BE9
MSNQGEREFWVEIEMLLMLRHCNLVSLIGYCNYIKEKILVYEYMPNGTLDDHLHKLCSPLSWLKRLNICIGAGRGLHYLHTGTGIESGPTNQPSTYINTHVKGSFGYFDPNYFSTGKLTRKSDVYAFGVVMLELLCRKRAVDRSLEEGLVTWVQDSMKEGNLKHIIDSDIRGEISPKCLKEFVRIAEMCLHSSSKHRPTMAEVMFSLESVLALQVKFNNSLQSAGKTIFGRMVNLFPFSSNREISGDSKLSSNSKGNNIFSETKEVPADFQSSIPSVKEFGFDDLKISTRDFSPDLLLGEGGFGKVYLGWVDKNTLAPSKEGVGIAVAIKRLNQQSVHGHKEWLAEVDFLGHLAHPNIIRLLGYCRDEPAEHLLVYEYMPHKTLDRFLFTDGPYIGGELSWGTRVLIMIGAARGLTSLQSANVIYRDFKASNIYLDEDFNAKLGDFGLARYGPETGKTHVSTGVMGTYGYAAPEYITTGHLSMKTDIYGFGVVLLETLSGQKALDYRRPKEQQNLVNWATQIKSSKRRLHKLMDPCLEHKYSLEAASECFALALRCIAAKPKDRPSSEEVYNNLEQIYVQHKE